MDRVANSETFFIGRHGIGPGFKTFIIAEIAQTHEGSLGTAHAYIDAVAETGADAIKFQTHLVSEESTLDEPFRVNFGSQDNTRYDYWKRMAFTEDQWRELADHSRKCGLVFLSSPFSIKAVDILKNIGMAAWKIGSGEVNSPELFDAMAENGAPILLSTGMSRFNEIEGCIRRIREKGLSFAVFQCTTKYPTPFEEVGLNVMEEIRTRFRCPVGLSDHSGSIFPGMAAMAMGARLLEVHVTIDRRLFGPDVIASVTVDELRMLSDASKAFHVMFCHPVDKDHMAEGLMTTRALFTKSLAPVRDLPKGTILKHHMLTPKKPGTGIPPTDIGKVISRRLRQDVAANRLLKWEDLE